MADEKLTVEAVLQGIIEKVSSGRKFYFGDHTGYEPQFSSAEVEQWKAVLEMRDRGHEALRKAAQKLIDACYVIGWNSLPMSLLHDFQAVKEALVGDGPLEGRSLIDNEILADLYIRLSGKTRHASDCATSVAPAETPGPCDCNVPEPAALTPAAPETPTEPLVRNPFDTMDWGKAQPPADGPLVEQMCVAFSAVKGNDMTRCMTAAMQVCLSSRDKEWSGWGIVEIAVRNPSVAEYMKHWEDRVKVAEDKLASRNLVALPDVELKAKTDKAYCDYLAQMSTPECLGAAIKLATGTFGERELQAHHRAGELLGAHRAYVDIRARLQPGPAKQRVTVGATNGHWIVYQDGLEVFHLDKGRYTKLGAERYANGLRAEIAEKGKAE